MRKQFLDILRGGHDARVTADQICKLFIKPHEQPHEPTEPETEALEALLGRPPGEFPCGNKKENKQIQTGFRDLLDVLDECYDDPNVVLHAGAVAILMKRHARQEASTSFEEGRLESHFNPRPDDPPTNKQQ